MDNKQILAEAIVDGKNKAEILAQHIAETQNQMFEYLNDLEGSGGDCLCKDGGKAYPYIWSDGFRGGDSVLVTCLKCGGDIDPY